MPPAPSSYSPWSAPETPRKGPATNPWSTPSSGAFFGNVGSGAGLAQPQTPVLPKPGEPGYDDLLKAQQDWVNTGGSVAPGGGSPAETHGPDPGAWAQDLAANQAWVDSGGSVAPGMGAPVDPARAPAPTGPGVLSGPGPNETAWAEHGNEFFTPGPAENFLTANAGLLGQPSRSDQLFGSVSGMGAPQVENRAGQAFDTYQREMPAMIQAPDLGSYYDFAEEQAQRSLSDAQAARGVFGSSVASRQAGDLSRGLRAEQANREADYNLARNADRRATLEGLSGAGRAGDITDLQNAGNEMDWRGMLGQLAGSADAANLGRLGLGAQVAGQAGDERLRRLSSGMTASEMAQSAGEGRERGALQDMTNFWTMLSQLAGQTYGSELGSDQALLDAIISGRVGGATSAYGVDERNSPVSEAAAILDALGGAKKAGLI